MVGKLLLPRSWNILLRSSPPPRVLLRKKIEKGSGDCLFVFSHKSHWFGYAVPNECEIGIKKAPVKSLNKSDKALASVKSKKQRPNVAPSGSKAAKG
ncbi:hypothetical protein AVEN_119360-1 [Araneus ventricosus]|uniref:Uncharacterized protein n=1 Tax=Araneus ventricosus TaxID=182803 RepID=A0A4Y2PZ35_ARAVE|nr:hypothetical protein AVEN_119360-1 [Araneus ventricosus]